MRIAVFHNLPSGGAKRSLQSAIRGLAGEHHVDVFTLESADHVFADLRPYSRRHQVVRFKPMRLLRSPFGRLNQIFRLIDLYRLQILGKRVADQIDRGGYDVALVHPCRYENGPSVLRYLARTPSVFYCHELLRLLYEPAPQRPYDKPRGSAQKLLDHLDPLPRAYKTLLGQLDRDHVRSAGMVLVNSKYTRENVRRAYGVDAYVSYPGVDTDTFVPRGLARERTVLAVGSLTPLKGHDFPIQALSRIPARQRPPLRIASNFENPAERAYLEQLSLDLGVQIRLASAVDDSRLVRYYNQAAFTVSVPIREPLGLVALESMACATAVVGVNEGGIPEVLVDGTLGLLVPRDPDILAAAIVRLLLDPDLAAEYGQAGRRKAITDWSWDTAVVTLTRLLVRAVEMRSPVPFRSSAPTAVPPRTLET